MSPFDFIITLFSFVYSLAIAHVLAGVGRAVRHRRTVTWSLPHAIWTANIILLIVANWLSLWDFRQLPTVSLTTVALGGFYALLLYLIATFVTPDVEAPEERDLRQFHERERNTYIGATVVLILTSLILNWAAGHAGVSNWAEQNLLVLLMLPVSIAALLAKRRWFQIATAALMTAGILAFAIVYYPVLR